MILAGQLFDPAPRGPCLVEITDGRFSAIEAISAFDCPPRLIVPGFVDLQVNGAGGVDFARDEPDLATARRVLARHGITTFLPTLISSTDDRYASERLELLLGPDEPGLACTAGVHLEGPFLAKDRAGAHRAEDLRAPDRETVTRLAGHRSVRLVTLAPELDGSLDAIGRADELDVVFAVGHSDASVAETEAAIASGVRLGTHLFNAMRPLHHRDPGIVGAILTADVGATIIADGVHVAPSMLRLAHRVKGPDRLAIVTDAIAGFGLPAGPSTLGSHTIRNDGRVGRLPDGSLAGSATPPAKAIRTLVGAGVPLADAIRMATETPARMLGLSGPGTIQLGGPADRGRADARPPPE